MLTQSTPAIISALEKSLSPQAIKQLTQALGNCGQPLTHRGPVNLQPGAVAEAGGPGVYNGEAWSPNDYADLLEYNPGSFYDLADFNSEWNSHNYSGDNFYFPTTQNFVINNFNYGPGVRIGGETITERLVTREIVFLPSQDGEDGRDGRDGRDALNGIDGINGINGSDGVNGLPGAAGAQGERGHAGPVGSRGSDGRDGRQGVPGVAGQNGRLGQPGPAGRDGRDGVDGITRIIPGDAPSIIRPLGQRISYLTGRLRTTPTYENIPTAINAISDVNITLNVTPTTSSITSISGSATLDPDTCAISIPTASVDVLTGVSVTATVTTESAGSDIIKVLSSVIVDGLTPETRDVLVPSGRDII